VDSVDKIIRIISKSLSKLSHEPETNVHAAALMSVSPKFLLRIKRNTDCTVYLSLKNLQIKYLTIDIYVGF
jgi:hypothetical protein